MMFFHNVEDLLPVHGITPQMTWIFLNTIANNSNVAKMQTLYAHTRKKVALFNLAPSEHGRCWTTEFSKSWV